MNIYDYIQSAADTAEMPLCDQQDSSKYSIELINDAEAKKTRGGYTIIRARTTRKQRRRFSTGFTAITEEQRATLEAFWHEIGAGSKSFFWIQPITGEKIRVIFPEGESMKFSYSGIGKSFRWDCSFNIEEV